MTHLVNNIYAVEVPEDAAYTPKEATFSNFIPHCKSVTDAICWIMPNGKTKVQNIPPGNWSFISTSKECTEEQAAVIMKGIAGNFWYDKSGEIDINRMKGIDTLNNGLRSLLTSKNITGNCAIIKKEE